MKTFINHGFKKLERVEINGTRFYDTGDAKYPSVTSITSMLSSQGIAEWKAAVGEEEAKKVSSRAAARGTEIHSLCENYLLGKDAKPNMFDAEMFNSLVPHLDRIDNIHALESPLYSHHLQVAGTVDCIAEYDGKLAVIDFKTASRAKEKDDIHGYFMQTSAYAVAFEELTGLPVSRLIIIMGVDNERPIIFNEKRDDWIKGFIKLRQEYREWKKL